MTRYPKAGKGSKRTIKELAAAKPEWKGDTLSDTEGLSGEVRVTSNGSVSIVFRYGFKWQGKKLWHYCGSYPASDLAEIRNERDKSRDLVKAGVDPRANKKSVRIEAQAAVDATIKADEQKRTEALTFNDLYQAWIKDGVNRSDGNKYITQSFGKHALPALGNIEVHNLTEHHLRNVYRAIIAKGKTATAVELSKDIGQMLRWAEKRKPWRALIGVHQGADRVSLADANQVGACQSKGKIIVSVLAKIGFINRLDEVVEADLYQVARNDAADAGADTLVKGESQEFGKRTFDMYKCRP